MSLKKAYILIISILLIDQISKIYIKTHFFINEEVKVFDVRGRLLFDKKNINATSTQINLGTTNQVLVLEITTNESVKIIKKYVN